MRSRIGGETLRYGQCGGYRLRGGRSGHEHSGRLTGPRAERTRPQMCARRRRSARRWAGCASWRGKRGRLTLRGNQRSAWQYRRQSATAGAANLGWCAIAGMRSLENRKSAIVGSASVHSCAIAGAKRGRRRYGAMERTAGFDGTAQGHPHYRGRTDGTWSCAGQSESAGASRFNRRTRCRNAGTGVSRRRATARNRTRPWHDGNRGSGGIPRLRYHRGHQTGCQALQRTLGRAWTAQTQSYERESHRNVGGSHSGSVGRKEHQSWNSGHLATSHPSRASPTSR